MPLKTYFPDGISEYETLGRTLPRFPGTAPDPVIDAPSRGGILVSVEDVFASGAIPDMRITDFDIGDMDRREDNLEVIRAAEIAAAQAAMYPPC